MISIIIPTYNSSTSLRKTLSSIFKQTYKDFEIIITPLSETHADLEAFAELGVDRLVLHLGSQRPERLEKRLAELRLRVHESA